MYIGIIFLSSSGIKMEVYFYFFCRMNCDKEIIIMLQAFVIQKDRLLCTFYFYSFYMTQVEYYAIAAPFTTTKNGNT